MVTMSDDLTPTQPEDDQPRMDDVVEPEVEALPVETDEEILLDGEGDEEFLQYALQYKDHPKRMGRDFKFLTRLAARRARRSGDITAAEHRMIVDLIRKPVRMRDGKPYDAWQAFETKAYAAMPPAGLSNVDWTTIWQAVLVWFKENWPEILKLLLTVLMCLDPPPVPKRKRHWRDK